MTSCLKNLPKHKDFLVNLGRNNDQYNTSSVSNTRLWQFFMVCFIISMIINGKMIRYK